MVHGLGKSAAYHRPSGWTGRGDGEDSRDPRQLAQTTKSRSTSRQNPPGAEHLPPPLVQLFGEGVADDLPLSPAGLRTP